MTKLFATQKSGERSNSLELLGEAMAFSPERSTIYRLDKYTGEFKLVYQNRSANEGETSLDTETLKEFLRSSLESNKPFRKKLEWNLETDKYQASEWTGVSVKDEFVLLQERSITISSLEMDSMKLEISSDWLTNISNRKGINEFLDENLKTFQGEFLFGIFDLNDFKSINDSYGHLAGDKVLREIAKIATAWIGPNGIVARVGGDEFAFFQPMTDQTTADETLQDLKSIRIWGLSESLQEAR